MSFLEAWARRAKVSFRCQRASFSKWNVRLQQARQCKHCGEYHVSYIVTRASGGMADALASGASVLRDVGVQVPLRPQRAVEQTATPEVTNSKGLVTSGFFCFSVGSCRESYLWGWSGRIPGTETDWVSGTYGLALVVVNFVASKSNRLLRNLFASQMFLICQHF